MNRIISVYELIGLIKDGKAPKRIIFDTTEYKYGCGYYYRIDNEVPKIFTNEYNIFMCLNEEVEIIEEDKPIIEKIKMNGESFYSEYINSWIKKENSDAYCEYLSNKLNEIIDYINSIGKYQTITRNIDDFVFKKKPKNKKDH